MLSIKPLGSSNDELAYYSRLGEAERDYYSQDGVRPGKWFGVAAAKLGLEGDVDPVHFRRLLEGLHPNGQSSLVQKQRGLRGRRAGFDLTLSLPKSYSIVWSLLSREERERLDSLTERAVHRTLEIVQQLCGQTRRGKGSLITQEADLLFAVFSHDTARGLPGQAPDANRHYHCVMPNVALRQDGTSGAVDARPLFTRRQKHAIGALFRSEVSMLLREELGIETYRPSKEGRDERVSWWEVVGVPAGLIRAMSKRRTEIEAWLRRHGLAGARAAERAALVTRQGKQRFRESDLSAAWSQQAKAFGFDNQIASRLLGQGLAKTEDEKQGKAKHAAATARAGLLDHNARFTRNELLERAAVEAQCQGVGIDEVLKATELELTANAEIIRLADKESVPSYTTRRMLRLERLAIETAQRLSGSYRHPVSQDLIDRIAGDYPTLKAEQRDAIIQLAAGPDTVCIEGLAGTGKTYMLGVAKRILVESGYRLIGTSLAARAAKVLQAESRIESTHLDRLFIDLERGDKTLGRKTVVIVDEAATVGTRHLSQLLGLAERAGAKLVLVGDHRQTQPVAAGAPFRLIADRIGATPMTEVIRQREPWARQVVLNLREGKTGHALAEIDRRGRLYIEAEREEAIDRLSRHWEALTLDKTFRPQDTVVMAATVADTRELNERLQEVMRRRGQLGDYAVEVDGQSIHLGDRVMMTRNHRLLGVENGSTGEVTGATGTTLWVRLDTGFEVEVETQSFPHITLSYAQTVHKSQGTTCDHACYFVSSMATDRELSYVAASRARETTFLYTYEAAALGIDELAAMMSRSRQNEMAIEHVREPA